MEQHHQQNVGAEEMSMSMNGGKMSNNNNNTNNNSNNSNNYNMCRQSSTRWTPTTEQIKLLKELYYIKGVRSPSADEIQHICTRLRRYGKIEGKNVFYWFQNHKARERQKKRFNHSTSSSSTLLPNNNNNINNNNPIITPNNINNNNPIIANNTTNNNGFIINNNNNGGLGWKQDHHQDITLHAKYPSCTLNNPGVSCSSSSGGLISGGGQLMGSFGYGAVTMENKFRDCSISSGGGGYMLNGGNQWSGVGTNYNPYATPPNYSNFLDKISSIDEEDSYIEQDYYYGASQTPHIETLPLFPMHNDDHHHHHDDDYGYGHDHHHHHDYNHHGFCPVKPQPDGYYTGGYRWPNGMGATASLELSLNSYGYGCYSQNL